MNHNAQATDTPASLDKLRAASKAALYTFPVGCLPIALANAGAVHIFGPLIVASGASLYCSSRIKTQTRHLAMAAFGALTGFMTGAAAAVLPFLEPVSDATPPAMTEPQHHAPTDLQRAPSPLPLQSAAHTLMQPPPKHIIPAILYVPSEQLIKPQKTYRM